MAVPASAAPILDFTDNSEFSGAPDTPISGSFFGTNFTINAFAPTPGVEDNLRFDETNVSGTCFPQLACEQDGLGVGNSDEVSNLDPEDPMAQRVRIDFDDAIPLNGIYLLDLYTSNNGLTREVASLDVNETGPVLYEADLDQRPGGTEAEGDSGNFFIDLDGENVSSLIFTAPDAESDSPDAQGNDGLGVNDFAIAGIAAVPVPASVFLLGGALGGLGLFGRRSKRKSA